MSLPLRLSSVRGVGPLVGALACLLPGAGPHALAQPAPAATERLTLNAREYLEMTGLNVMLAHDIYPESHQGGVGIIQNGLRTATNGDLRLEPTPGQWQPVPKVGPRQVYRERQELSVRLEFPDPEKNRRGFNPIDYPDLNLAYTVRVTPAVEAAAAPGAFRIRVDLEQPLPEAWVGRVGFNLELFPGYYFGKSYMLDAHVGQFPRQANGPGASDPVNGYQVAPLATGRRLTAAPESAEQRLTIEAVRGGELQLLDGRAQHNNGWFVVRALVPGAATTGALEWLVTPHAIPGWRHAPVIQVSQVGYHPAQAKIAVLELDARDDASGTVELLHVGAQGELTAVLTEALKPWGEFLRYRYAQFDFSRVTQPGLYVVRFRGQQTHAFQIRGDVYARDVWQPTLETFLPAQMCHVRVNDRYRVWHGVCHLDDARMAPINHNHFDGYRQGPSTLTPYQPGQHVPGLDRGGWHDAGDHDLRVESQTDTIHGLALAWETFGVAYDNTSVDQATRVVELFRPDGRPDILQQIEHGALSVVGGYRALGRLYRGVITPTLRQYVLLGDAAVMTDNVPFAGDATNATFAPSALLTPVPSEAAPGTATPHAPASSSALPALSSQRSALDPAAAAAASAPDDNWVFTEDNPRRELAAAAGLAAGARALREFNPELSRECLAIAQELWARTQEPEAQAAARAGLAAELFLATRDVRYAQWLVEHRDAIAAQFARVGWLVARTVPLIDDARYRDALTAAARTHAAQVDAQSRETPYGVPYRPDIWGAGWGIQRFGVTQFFLHTAFPELYSREPVLHALNFILGCHPGTNTSSFVSGVGARSLTAAYGTNRAEFSHIPGGVGSGTALIRPDFPELLEWPFLWQQTEYCLGYPTTDYLTLVLAAEQLLQR